MKTATKTKVAKSVKKSTAPPRTAPKAKKTAVKQSRPAKKTTAPAPGLAFREFVALQRQLDVSLDELTARLGLSRATVAERKAAGRLTTDESGKVVSFARLLGNAMRLFGDLDEARLWLKTPQRGLHGAVPLDYAKTDLGAREVENLLSHLRARRRR